MKLNFEHLESRNAPARFVPSASLAFTPLVSQSVEVREAMPFAFVGHSNFFCPVAFTQAYEAFLAFHFGLVL